MFDTEERDGIQLSRQQPDRKKRLDFQPVSQPSLLTRRRIHIPANFAANASFKGFDEGWASVLIHDIGALWGDFIGVCETRKFWYLRMFVLV